MDAVFGVVADASRLTQPALKYDNNRYPEVLSEECVGATFAERYGSTSSTTDSEPVSDVVSTDLQHLCKLKLQDVQGIAPDSCSSPAQKSIMLPPQAGLYGMPSEIIHSICACLHNKSLCSFQMTCQKIAKVVKSALYEQAYIIHPRKCQTFLQHLYEHEDLVKVVKKVSFWPYLDTCDQDEAMFQSEELYTGRVSCILSICG